MPDYERKCDGCGGEFLTRRRNQRFCTKNCSNKLVGRHKVIPLPESRKCPCGAGFKPTRRDNWYCSRPCAVRTLRQHYLDTNVEYQQRAKAGILKWQQNNPEKVARYTKASRYRRRFGIELEDFEDLVAQQESLCEICGGLTALVPDHDHETGKFRGAICADCNSGLGLFADSPDRMLAAAAYLLKHGKSASVASGLDCTTDERAEIGYA